MEYIKLSNIAKISSGQNAPQGNSYYSNGENIFIKVSNLDDLIEDECENRASRVTDDAIIKCKLKKYPKGSIIFAKSGLSCNKNRVYLTKEDSFIVNHLCVLYDIDINYNSKWLSYFIKFHNVTRYIKDASYPSISLFDIGNIDIPIISKDIQDEIVKNVDKISSIIKRYRIVFNKMDKIVKSQFIEMFGTIDLSEERKEWVEIKEVSKIYTGTTPSTSDDSNWDGDILWITPAEMSLDTFYIYDTVRKITEKGRKSKSLDLMPINTVLLSTRAPIGKVGIVGTPMTCNQGFKNFECGNTLNPIFLYTLLRNNTIYLNSLGSGTTFLEVSKTTISKLRIPLPPLELQNKFADFVQQIDKSKFIVQKQIKLLEELLEKKMNEYFGD